MILKLKCLKWIREVLTEEIKDEKLNYIITKWKTNNRVIFLINMTNKRT